MLDFYTDGFSAVNFNCNENNFRIGNVNLSDARHFIEEITAPGVQVKMIQIVNYYLVYKIGSLSIGVIWTFLIIQKVRYTLQNKPAV